MAEAVIEVVLDNLSSLLKKEVTLFLGFDRELKSLASLLTTIKATLEDAEEKQFSNRAVKDWLHKLKDAAHVLDDILDECATEAIQLEYEGFDHKVLSSCLSSLHPKHVAFRYKVAKKMKKIRERLDEIAAERTKFHFTEIVRERKSGVMDWRQTTSIITQPRVYGRDEDMNKIVGILVDDPFAACDDDLPVYPIVGLGGLGKTTLAQLVYNNERVVNHFELRIWVCVSEDFTSKRMTKAIIEAASGHACEDLDLEPLQKKLLDLLQRKRYLLVLDDVWEDEHENWQRLRSVLSCGGKGASILVTTRLPKVAITMGTMPLHDLSVLSDNDCWELFKQRAFGPNEEEEHAHLVAIGKEIVKKCGGVPLAAIALGSLLRFKREENEWLYIKENRLWSLPCEKFVMPALRLSYLNLSVKLRQCFAFCALFPKDAIINKHYLIELWMTSGIISSNKMLEVEDVGNEIWNELYWRSFFQDIKTDEFGKITCFKMHDLVHDLAQSVAAEDIYCITNDNNGVHSVAKRFRHLSICRDALGEANSIQLNDLKSLKTCITQFADKVPPNILKCYSLRVLEFVRRKELSSSIGNLKYLRYLNLSRGKFKTLPESLGRLFNLQILKLEWCIFLQKLPDSLIHLKALQHMYLRGCYSLSSFPPHISKLTSLKTLSMYIVGNKRECFLVELGQLNLKGELNIKHLERVKSVMDAKDVNMSSKQLSQLQLWWASNEESQLHENAEQILEVLQPQPQRLETLVVVGYAGTHFPQWMSSPFLKYLNSVQLGDCRNCIHLPQLGKLPSLKKLTISNMSHVIYIEESESYESGVVGGFIALEFLSLSELPNLIRLSREDRQNMFTRLSTLNIAECPKLLGLPGLSSLNDMRIEGKCNQELLSSIHKLDSLNFLQFAYNEEITCFPDEMLQNLTCLKAMSVYGLSKLEQLPAEIMNINEVFITDCENLKSLRDEVLPLGVVYSLKKLIIAKCKKFNLSEAFQYLTSLEILVIDRCTAIEGLHEALQHMTALKSFTLEGLPNLASLPDWLGNLSSLHELFICMCPRLMCLPMSIQCLTSLKRLRIDGCSRELGKRCEKETGEDWSKIAHVQNIEIQRHN